MKDLIHFLQQADRYLDGHMAPDERARFEAFCSQDAEAGQLLKEQADIRKYLVEYHDTAHLKGELNQAYDAWKAKESLRGQPSGERPSAGKPVIFMKRYLWKIAGIAAAIALLITAGGVWLSQNYSDHKINSYTILRREIDNIKRSQNSLMNDIHSKKAAPANPGQYGGTGFAISSAGFIATNAHVVAGADSIYVETAGGESLKASIVYQDTHSDLAILKVMDSTFSLPALPYDLRKTAVPLGDEVYTLGYPRNEIVYGKGYVSAETGFRGDSDSYQISIPVNPGNSGGPLIDTRGQVLGIITGKQSPSDDIAFAVKSSFLLDMLDSLPKGFNKNALLHKQSSLQHLSRVDQIKKLQPFVFMVKVYN
jgi:hypothetical protein